MKYAIGSFRIVELIFFRTSYQQQQPALTSTKVIHLLMRSSDSDASKVIVKNLMFSQEQE